MAQTYWAVLMDRQFDEQAVNALLNVAEAAAQAGAVRLYTPYQRVDTARNRLVNGFLAASSEREDTLVMLDADHLHPAQAVPHLASFKEGVVGLLYFRRTNVYSTTGPDPLMFHLTPTGFEPVREWTPGALVACDMVGTGAIAVKRWVFEALGAAGCPRPWFRYVYKDGESIFPTEDAYFGLLCHHAGIPHFCDTGLVTAHLTWETIDADSYRVYQEATREVEAVLPAALRAYLQPTGKGVYYCPDDPGRPVSQIVESERPSTTLAATTSIVMSEGPILAGLVRDKEVFEIGTGLGVSTCWLASTARRVDTYDTSAWVQEKIYPLLAEKRNVTTWRRLPGVGAFDAVFIDGDHHTGEVLKDIQWARSHLRERGWILLHDTRLPEVRAAYDQVAGQFRDCRLIDTPSGIGCLGG
jgi:hypothetical protein